MNSDVSVQYALLAISLNIVLYSDRRCQQSWQQTPLHFSFQDTTALQQGGGPDKMDHYEEFSYRSVKTMRMLPAPLQGEPAYRQDRFLQDSGRDACRPHRPASR